jgi:hypothetical protein
MGDCIPQDFKYQQFIKILLGHDQVTQKIGVAIFGVGVAGKNLKNTHLKCVLLFEVAV